MRIASGLIALALVGCVSAPTQGREPQIADFNHLFATIDPVTAEAIKQSELLRRFANVEVRTTTGTRGSWTGRYLYGRRTYIEFFAPDDFQINDRPAPIGAWGLALSGDRVGFNRQLARRLAAAGHQAVIEMDTRKFGDRVVPWFEALTAVSEHGDSGGRGESVSVWAMEYQPSYFELPEVAKEPEEKPDDLISRERYQSDLFATKMMRDIVEVHFDVGHKDFERIEPLLKAAGYQMTRAGDEVTADGEDTDLRFSLTDPAAKGLRFVRFALNAPTARHVETIGRSTLVIGPADSATWTFEPMR